MKGFTSIPNSFLDEVARTLTSIELTLWIQLYRNTKGRENQKFPYKPSHEDLAKITNLGITSIKKSLKSLKQKGLIDYKSGKGRGNRTEYKIINFNGETTPGNANQAKVAHPDPFKIKGSYATHFTSSKGARPDPFNPIKGARPDPFVGYFSPLGQCSQPPKEKKEKYNKNKCIVSKKVISRLYNSLLDSSSEKQNPQEQTKTTDLSTETKSCTAPALAFAPFTPSPRLSADEEGGEEGVLEGEIAAKPENSKVSEHISTESSSTNPPIVTSGRSGEEKVFDFLERKIKPNAENEARAFFKRLLGSYQAGYSSVEENMVRWYASFSEQSLKLTWDEAVLMSASAEKKPLFVFIDFLENPHTSSHLSSYLKGKLEQEETPPHLRPNESLSVGGKAKHLGNGNIYHVRGFDHVWAFCEDQFGQPVDISIRDLEGLSE